MRCHKVTIVLGAENSEVVCETEATLCLENGLVPDLFMRRFYCEDHGPGELSFMRRYMSPEYRLVPIGEEEE